MKNTVRILTLVVLISICWLEPALAEITIDGESVHVETDAYTVRFDKGVIAHIYNKRTAELYTYPNQGGIRGETGILRLDDRGYPTIAIWASQSTMEVSKTSQNSATMVFRRAENEIILTIEVEVGTGDLLIGGSGVADTTGVYGFQWGCENLDIANIELILPAHGGQVITSRSAFDAKTYYYPELWEAQLAIVQGDRGGFFVRATDNTFRFKRFNLEKDGEVMAIGFESHNQAPFGSLTRVESVRWRFNTYAGDYRIPASIYQDWMDEAFEPWRLSDMPSWVKDIGLVVTTRALHHIQIDVLSKLAEQIDPSKTLVYVVIWRKGYIYDRNYPDYTPDEDFGDFIKAVHDLGYRTMLHANLVGVSPDHPLYAELQAYQFRSPWDNGSLVGWRWHETENPGRFAYINMASSKFRNLLVARLQQVWEQYSDYIDAFHLDISSVVLNDENGLIDGLTAAQGNILMHKQLAEAMPGVVFSGEHLHEVTFFRESFAQRFSPPWEITPHPISTFLFSPYTRFYGHLGIPNATIEPLRYQAHLDSYERWGVIPTLRSVALQDMETAALLTQYNPIIQHVLSIARQWQEWGLRPDFESDWGTDTLFRYVTENGQAVVYQDNSDGLADLMIVVGRSDADLNQDGVINVLDLVFVANNFGTPDGDVNGDGETNILDLVVVSQHF